MSTIAGARSVARTMTILLGAAALGASAAAPAQGTDELWEISTKIDMAGMPMAMPGQAKEVCLPKNHRDEDYVPKRDNCTTHDVKRTGNKMTFRMECTGKDASTMEGEMTFVDNGYTGKMKMTMGRDTMNMNMSGKRIGNCTDNSKELMASYKAKGDEAIAKTCREGIDKLQAILFQDPKSVCAPRRGEFCTRAGQVAQEAQSPEGWRAVRQRNYVDLKSAFTMCNQDLAASKRIACKRGFDARNYDFLGDAPCDDEVRVVGKQQCEGRSFTAIPASLSSLCGRYAKLGGKFGGEDEDSGDSSTARAKSGKTPVAAEKKAPSSADAVQEGMNQLKKLLPF